MPRCIDVDAFREEYDLREHCEECGRYGKKDCDYPSYSARDFCGWLDDAPTIDAVPIKAISEWLAAYAAPPKYALDHFSESGHCLANTRAAAWEHHIRTMMECGLLREEPMNGWEDVRGNTN